jgi:DNA mismatch repair protein MutS2
MKLWVDLSEVRAIGKPVESELRELRSDVEPPRPPALMTVDNTVDVRGMRVDDALGLVESFLDRMFGSSQAYAFVVHGVGTGALRDAIRELLTRSSTYVKSHRPGTPDEGGPRLTVVELR